MSRGNAGSTPGPKRGRSVSRDHANSSLNPKGIIRNPSKSPKRERVRFHSSVNETEDQEESTVHYEFGGPLGAIGIIFGLPFVIMVLYFLSSEHFGHLTFENLSTCTFDFNALYKNVMSSEMFITQKSVTIFLSWMGLQVILERILPGDKVEGVAPHKLIYTISGHLQLWITLLFLLFCSSQVEEENGSLYFKTVASFDLTQLYDEYLGLITISCLFSLVLSIYLYASSFIGERPLAEGGNTGNVVYDFFIGRELNPRIGSLDLKEFCELRPGLIGWLVLNFAMAAAQFKAQGHVSMSMVLVCAYQGLYVWDALFNERAILTTMDITTDGFGYMLAFGDLAWVPFIYSLQARYLVKYDPGLSPMQLLLITALHFLGMYIFRSANSEKDAFRRNPKGEESAHLEYMDTQRGTKLLVSGWWGMARKINYTGDWLITLAWCLLCGFDSPIPYFQAIYFLVLLIHRADRDDKLCAEKYGDDWVEYKKRVPYIFVPGVI